MEVQTVVNKIEQNKHERDNERQKKQQQQQQTPITSNIDLHSEIILPRK